MSFARSKKIYDAPALYQYAVGALGRRMRTVAELKRLLRQRNIAGDAEAVMEAVVEKLKEQRYLNDSVYAAAYASSRKEGEKLGRQRVITGLKSKGVHPSVVEKTVAAAYADVDEEQLARAYLARKRMKKPSSEKETARIFRALVRAGFRTGTIIRILKKWKVDDEVLTALEEESS